MSLTVSARACIRYSEGWKYRLERDLVTKTSIRPATTIVTDWITLETDGTLWMRKGYCWDGPSGPALDTPSFMRASGVHDAFHQLMRLGLLPQSARKDADSEMRRIAKEDGMWAPRRAYTWLAVRWFAAGAADPANQDPIKCAPGGCEQCSEHELAEAVSP